MLDITRIKGISAIAAELTPAQLKQLKLDPQVERIEDDSIRTSQAVGTRSNRWMNSLDNISLDEDYATL